MSPRDRRPEAERGPVDWGTARGPAQARPAGPRGQARPGRTGIIDEALDGGAPTAGSASTGSTAGLADSTGTDWGVGRGRAHRRGKPADGPDWGVGRGSAGPHRGGGRRPASPWPAAARKQRLVGVVFALIGLVLATVSAMNLAHNAEAGRLWVPPWLVAVLGGAGLVAAAGYLAWAGGTPVRQEAQRWRPSVVDAAAGLTTGTVEVHDPQRLLAAGSGPRAPGLPGGSTPPGSGAEAGGSHAANSAYGPGSATGTVEVHDPQRLLAAGSGPRAPGLPGGSTPPGSGAEAGGSHAANSAYGPGSATGSGPGDGAAQESVMDSGPRPLMGTSTVDQSMHAPAGVAGAVGGFLLAGAVVCAVIALVLGPVWLIATAALALGGMVSVYLAKDWLGAI